MAKLTINDITSGYISTTALNTAFTAIETALENTLSRDGTSPNQMQSNLDMNGYAVLNARATSGNENFIWMGTWTTGTVYAVNNLVYASEGTNEGATLIAVTAHTAGATLNGDSAKWAVFAQRGASGAGTGDVVGPASSTADSLARFNGTTGKLLKDGAVIGTDVQAYSAKTASYVANTLTAANKIPYATALDTAGELDFKDEDDLVSDSATAVPSQQSVKAYVDASIPSGITYGTIKTVSGGTLSGATADFTIPAAINRITICLDGVSFNGTSNPLVQLGDSGGIEISGYLGAGAYAATGNAAGASNYTTGFGIFGAQDANTYHGTIYLNRVSGNTWAQTHTVGLSNTAAALFGGGSKTLSAELTTVRITTVGGANTFDAGGINISYE